jgi:hypothetical protein
VVWTNAGGTHTVTGDGADPFCGGRRCRSVAPKLSRTRALSRITVFSTRPSVWSAR